MPPSAAGDVEIGNRPVTEIVLATARVVRVRGRVDVAWLGKLVRALETARC